MTVQVRIEALMGHEAQARSLVTIQVLIGEGFGRRPPARAAAAARPPEPRPPPVRPSPARVQ